MYVANALLISKSPHYYDNQQRSHRSCTVYKYALTVRPDKRSTLGLMRSLVLIDGGAKYREDNAYLRSKYVVAEQDVWNSQRIALFSNKFW